MWRANRKGTMMDKFTDLGAQSNSMDIEDLTLEEAEVVAAGVTTGELVIGGIIVFGAVIIIL